MIASPDPNDWLRKARQDLRAAQRLLEEPPEPEVSAYPVQQAVEKALKAALFAAGIAFPRSSGAGHDLVVLAGLIPEGHPIREAALSLTDLTPWATAFRYPSDDPLTAEPPPDPTELARRIAEADLFIRKVADHTGRREN